MYHLNLIPLINVNKLIVSRLYMKHFISLTIIALLFILIGGQSVFAQKNDERPSWTYGYHHDCINSYIDVVSYSGRDLNECKQKAALIVIERRNLASGATSNIKIEDGNISVSGDNALVVKARIIDEYTEYLPNGDYMVYLLVQTAKNPSYDYEQVRVTRDYKFSPRVFVPGMAQIHKGSTGKGVAFITGEVIMVGGIVVGELMHKSFASKAAATHNTADKKRYVNNANICLTVRNVSIAGAAAVYVWNVIDGIAAKGRKHVMIGDANLKIAPYAAFDGGGLALNINF